MTDQLHRILTFKPRRRQISPARTALYERLRPTLCVEAAGGPFDAAGEFGRAAPLVARQEALGEAVRDPQALGAQLGLLLQELVGSGAIGRRQPVDLCPTLALTLLTLGRVVADVRSCSSRGRRG